MPRKKWRLLARDLSFYLTGGADVASADWRADPWAYPLDWSFQLDRAQLYFSPRDADGVPLLVLPPPIGARYLPSRIAGFALANWNRWSSRRDASSRDTFLRMAQWFVTNADDGRYFHDLLIAGKTEPWLSCIAQGQAVSVLVRAHRLTGEAGYDIAARRAAHWLGVSESDGGLLSVLPDGRPFLEEYPGTVYRHVLNGCLFAIVGLSDLSRDATNAPSCTAERALLASLVDAIGANVSAWDIAGWSTYDFPMRPDVARNLNTMTYQTLHVILLRYLFDMTGDARLRDTGERWARSMGRLGARLHALQSKLTYRAEAGW